MPSINPYDFWQSPNGWPEGQPDEGVTFLVPAVKQLGQAMLPEWDGREPWIFSKIASSGPPERVPSLQIVATPGQVAAAYRLLNKPLPYVSAAAHNAEAQNGSLPSGFVSSLAGPTRFRLSALPPSIPLPGRPALLGPPPLTDDEWRLAFERSGEMWQTINQWEQRWLAVRRGIFRLFKNNILDMRLRGLMGGLCERPPVPGLWATEPERVEKRFGLGVLDLTFPYQQASFDADDSGHDFRLIFVTPTSLNEALDAVRATPPVEASMASSEEVQASEGAPSPQVSEKLKKKFGRPPGTTSWDAEPFRKEYRYRLERDGAPSKQNVKGWTTREEASDTVNIAFYASIDPRLDPPSPSTAKAWARLVRAEWEAAGAPRAPHVSEKSKKSEKSNP